MDRMVVAVATRLSCLSNSMENLNMHQCSLKNLLHMSSIPYEVLKRGFSEFSRKIKIRKDKLNAKLSRVKPFQSLISSGWTMRETPLTRSTFLKHWNWPQTTRRLLLSWMITDRES